MRLFAEAPAGASAVYAVEDACRPLAADEHEEVDTLLAEHDEEHARRCRVVEGRDAADGRDAPVQKVLGARVHHARADAAATRVARIDRVELLELAARDIDVEHRLARREA